MATHSSVLDWRIPGTAEPGQAAVYGVAQSRTRLKHLAAAFERKIIVTIQKTLIGEGQEGTASNVCLQQGLWLSTGKPSFSLCQEKGFKAPVDGLQDRL